MTNKATCNMETGLLAINQENFSSKLFDETIFQQCAQSTKCHFNEVTFRRNGSLDEVSRTRATTAGMDRMCLSNRLYVVNQPSFIDLKRTGVEITAIENHLHGSSNIYPYMWYFLDYLGDSRKCSLTPTLTRVRKNLPDVKISMKTNVVFFL